MLQEIVKRLTWAHDELARHNDSAIRAIANNLAHALQQVADLPVEMKYAITRESEAAQLPVDTGDRAQRVYSMLMKKAEKDKKFREKILASTQPGFLKPVVVEPPKPEPPKPEPKLELPKLKAPEPEKLDKKHLKKRGK